MFSYGQLKIMEIASFAQSYCKAWSLETVHFSGCCLFGWEQQLVSLFQACTLGWLQVEWDVWRAPGSNSGDGGNLKVDFYTEVGTLSNVSIGLLQVSKLVTEYSEIEGW